MTIRPGNHLVHQAQPSWGVGRVIAVSKDGLRATVRFSGRPREDLQVSLRDAAVVRYRFQPGDEVRLRGENDAVVKGVVKDAHRGDEDVLLVAIDDQDDRPTPERSVVSLPPASGALEGLLRLEWGDAKNWQLRQSTLRLDVERRCDGLGALFSSRVMVKPYQVAVAQRVLSDRIPRYVLADEVGLGKTIEAGMILSALLHSGLARRVLVVTPAHLSVQWLTELLHKFNLRFALFDAERLEAEAKADEFNDPWATNDLVVTSLELLTRNAVAHEAASDADNRWDLVIVDEAHHLRGDRVYETAAKLAENAWGLLLLTATPLKLDPEEYFRLLKLVESAPAQDLEDFELRIDRQQELTEAVRAIEEASPKEVAKKAKVLAELFPDDEQLADLARRVAKEASAREALLDHLAEVYSLSARLIRNRRVVVGGFTPRRLHLLDVALEKDAQALQRQAHEAIRAAREAGTLPGGAPLSLLLRRVDSSPPAMAKALESRSEPALQKVGAKARALAGVSKDAKLRALRDKLKELSRAEPEGKFLVFTESRETLDYLVTELSREGLSPLWYHGDLPTLERDRMVARFRDPEGPRVLVSTEAGGEGRNFQFCHHLFHYDLPWSPSSIEQRIGRLDRVGQSRPVEIHVLRPLDTLAQRVVDLFADDVRVFTETVGGLDAVMEEVEGEILELASEPDEAAWKDYGKKLGKGVRLAREAMQRDYDPLLDRRSFDRDRVAAMLRRAHERAGLEVESDFDTPEDLEEGLLTVARELDERLEETVLNIARRIGIGVDTDENVEAFQCRLMLGSGLLVDGLAGIDLTEDKLIEGTFWRDTAVEREEIEYLATGHPLVEALMNFVRDGEFGRASVVKVKGPRQAVGAVLSYLVQMPEAEDLAQGSHVPSRQASRLLENPLVRVAVEFGADGSVQVQPELLAIVDDAGKAQTVRPDELPIGGARWEQAVRSLEQAAKAEVTRQVKALVAEARARLDGELARRLDRLSLDAQRGNSRERVLRAAEMVQEQNFAGQVRDALKGVRLTLDSAAVVFVEQAARVASTRHAAGRGRGE